MEEERKNFDDVSQFKFHSIGIAVEDIDPEDEEEGKLKVSPMERLNVQKPGFIHHFKDTYTNIHPDEREKIVNDSITSRNYVIAKWHPLFSPNRETPPTVRKNETVMLFKFGNVEEYFWTTIKSERHIRRRERARYSWSNIDPGDGGFKPYDKDTSYWIEVDTIKKKITIKTNDNDGEKAAYEIVINTGEGFIEAKDNKDNKVKWESEDGVLTADFKTRIHLKAGEEIILDAPVVRASGLFSAASNILSGGDLISENDVFGKRIRGAVINEYEP